MMDREIPSRMSEVRRALCQPYWPGSLGPRSLSAKICSVLVERRRIDGHMDRCARTHARENSPLLTKDIRDLHPRRSGNTAVAPPTDDTCSRYTRKLGPTQLRLSWVWTAALSCNKRVPSEIGQVRSVRKAKSSQIKSTPTHQQIGLLNRFLSTKVGQMEPGSTNLVCGYSARPRRGSARLQKKQQ